MKRIVLYALILVFVWIVPIQRIDIAKLEPVEVIAVYRAGDSVCLSTDTGDFGIGKDAMSALDNLHQTSAGIIYLDTAEYLLVGAGSQAAADQLRGELKPSVALCTMMGEIDLAEAAKYLDIHGKLPQLRRWNAKNELPILTVQNGRMRLKNNS